MTRDEVIPAERMDDRMTSKCVDEESLSPLIDRFISGP